MNELEFSIKVTMRERWVPHFLGMLKRMQYLGGIGATRRITFVSDGDGDYSPVFEWDDNLPSPAGPRKETQDGDQLYDAG